MIEPLTWVEVRTAAKRCGITSMVLLALGFVATQGPASGPRVVPLYGQACQEGMTCWNCHTMGNHVCGKETS